MANNKISLIIPHLDSERELFKLFSNINLSRILNIDKIVAFSQSAIKQWAK